LRAAKSSAALALAFGDLAIAQVDGSQNWQTWPLTQNVGSHSVGQLSGMSSENSFMALA
jgi:hypothetical protein